MSILVLAVLWPGTATVSDPTALPHGAMVRLGSPHLRHAGGVACVALSPDGKVLATGGEDLVLWDAATGRPRHRFGERVAMGSAGALAFSTDGRTLVAAGRQAELWLVEVATGRRRTLRLEEQTVPGAVALSRDGQSAAVVTHGHGQRPDGALWKLSLWDLAAGRELARVGLDDEVGSLAFAPSGLLVAGAGEDGAVYLWDAATGDRARRFGKQDRPVRSVAFSDDGARLLSGDGDGAVTLWDVATWKPLRRWDADYGGAAAVFLPGSRSMAVARADGSVRIIDANTGDERTRVGDHSSAVRGIAFSRDGRTMATASEELTARLWDVETGKERLPHTGHVKEILTLAFSPDGRWLASAGADRTVRLWDWRAGREGRRLDYPGKMIRHLEFAPSGNRLLAASKNEVHLWHLPNSQRTSWRPEGAEEISGLAFAPGGFVVSSETTGIVRRGFEGAEKHRHATELERWMAVFSRGAGLMAAVEGENVAVWDTDTGAEIARLTGEGEKEVDCLACSPDGRYLVFNRKASNDLVLWEVAEQAERHRWRVDVLCHSGEVAFSPDARLLAILDDTATLRVFEMASRGEVLTVAGPAGGSYCLAISPDGRAVATAGRDGTILVWDLTSNAKAAPPARTELAALWDDLSGEDAAKAYRAVWRLALAPGTSLPFLRERLRPVQVPAEDVELLIAGLDGRRFGSRRAAATRLRELADSIEPHLVRASREAESEEVRRLVGRLLADLPAERSRPTGERLRALRAVQALERMGTPEAERLLRELARGAPGATQTREATLALGRLHPDHDRLP